MLREEAIEKVAWRSLYSLSVYGKHLTQCYFEFWHHVCPRDVTSERTSGRESISSPARRRLINSVGKDTYYSFKTRDIQVIQLQRKEGWNNNLKYPSILRICNCNELSVSRKSEQERSRFEVRFTFC